MPSLVKSDKKDSKAGGAGGLKSCGIYTHAVLKNLFTKIFHVAWNNYKVISCCLKMLIFNLIKLGRNSCLLHGCSCTKDN